MLAKYSYLLYAVVNLGLLTALQASVVILPHDGNPRAVLLVSSLVVSVQVGQAVGMQSLLFTEFHPRVRLCTWTIAGLSGLVQLVTNLQSPIAAVALGVALGIVSITEAAQYLTVHSRGLFQLYMLLRNVLWLAFMTLALLPFAGSAPALTLSAIASWLITTAVWRAASRLRSIEHLSSPSANIAGAATNIVTLALGCVASLIYRNDVNVVRAHYIGTAAFFEIHWILLCYSLVNAAVGFYVIQLVYPRLRSARIRGERIDRRPADVIKPRLVALFCVGIIALFIAAYAADQNSPSGGLLGAVVMLPILALTVYSTVLSAEMHGAGHSAYVYAVGVMSIGWLLAGLAASGYHLGLATENTWLVACYLGRHQAHAARRSSALISTR